MRNKSDWNCSANLLCSDSVLLSFEEDSGILSDDDSSVLFSETELSDEDVEDCTSDATLSFWLISDTDESLSVEQAAADAQMKAVNKNKNILLYIFVIPFLCIHR